MNKLQVAIVTFCFTSMLFLGGYTALNSVGRAGLNLVFTPSAKEIIVAEKKSENAELAGLPETLPDAGDVFYAKRKR